MILSSLLLLCSHGSLPLKLHQKNKYLNEGWIFIGIFTVGSLPRRINKEVLVQFMYKSTYSTEKLLTMQNWKFITLAMYIEEKG